MKIIVVGCGKIGYTIARVLSGKKNVDVTIVDIRQEIFDNLLEQLDVILVTGSGLSETTLIDAGANDADLIVCTTNTDAVNILCCIMAKHLGTRHTIARIRDPEYASGFNRLLKDLGIDMAINPELQTAREISRLLRYPTAECLDTFVGGRVELTSYNVSETPDVFAGKKVSQVFSKKMKILLAVIERNNGAIIPNGDFVFEKSDVIKILGRPSSIMSFYTHLRGRPKSQEVMVIGGGKVTHYLAELLGRHSVKTNIKIIEKDRKKCETLYESISAINGRCLIVCGDGTNEEFLAAEDMDNADAFVCLTDKDEENAIISLYALQKGIKRVITKVNHIHQNMIVNLGLRLGRIVTPQNITSDIVAQYVDGLMGVTGNNMEAAYTIFHGGDGSVEAIEFQVRKRAKYLGVPIMNLNLKKGILIGCIVRGADIIIPSGETQILQGDKVIIISKNNEISDLDGILASKSDDFMVR